MKKILGKALELVRGLNFDVDPQLRRKISFAVVMVAMLLGYLLSHPALAPPPDATLKTPLDVERVLVTLKNGDTHEFDLEIARAPVDIEIGLMFRKKMDKDHGMMFQLGQPPREVSFWMKNTLIPLDMLFVAEDGTIVNIHRNAVPQSLTAIPSVQPVTCVIELNGGRAEKLGINIGDKVVHRYFRKAQPVEKTP